MLLAEDLTLPDLFPCKSEVQGERGFDGRQGCPNGGIIPRILIYGSVREEGWEMAAPINSTSLLPNICLIKAQNQMLSWNAAGCSQ